MAFGSFRILTSDRTLSNDETFSSPMNLESPLQRSTSTKRGLLPASSRISVIATERVVFPTPSFAPMIHRLVLFCTSSPHLDVTVDGDVGTTWCHANQ